jgi:hypothetical protein
MLTVIWTNYFKHRARLRGFDLAAVEQIVKFSEERTLTLPHSEKWLSDVTETG